MAVWEDQQRGKSSDLNPLVLKWDFDSLGGQKMLPQDDGSFLAQSYAPTKNEPWGEAVFDCETVTGVQLDLLTDPNLPQVVEPATSDLEPLQRDGDTLARAAAKWNPTMDGVMVLLRSLAEMDSEFTINKERSGEALFYRGRRLVLALDRLTTALNANRDIPLKLDPELKALEKDIAEAHGNLDAGKFSEHLRAFRGKL